MIANISPAAGCYEDTLNTLKYASRAKRIKVKASKNVITGEKDISEYTKILEALKRENMDLK
jgi:kinesin family protein 18/19